MDLHRLDVRSPRAVVAAVVAVCACSAFVPAPLAAAESNDGGWLRPVDGPVVRPFDEISSPYAAGHRGADFAAAPGTPVRAANDGVVTFAGPVADTLHVVVLHPGNLRTSYSFLSAIDVHAGQQVQRGDIVGRTGGTGPEHDGSVLHFGLRAGSTYLDPMLLFRPLDLTRVVRLVPAGDAPDTPWSSAAERQELQRALRLPAPGAPSGSSADGSGDDGGCGDGIPLIGDAVNAACDAAELLGAGADAALDAGLRVLKTLTGIGIDVVDHVGHLLHGLLAQLRDLPAELARVAARTPLGMLVVDLVEMGRRFVDTVSADCSPDSPPADGTGGSGHRVMVVAGIDSGGQAGNRGPTVPLDVRALGYHPDEREVHYFSYAPDGGPYGPRDTEGDIRDAAARLAEQLQEMQRENPGREVDLIAHSQGGVVVDWFLSHGYHAGDTSFPPLGTVVTLSSPHEGTPLATAGAQIRGTTLGKAALDVIGDHVSAVPRPNSTAVKELAEGSSVIQSVQALGVPDHFDFTSIGSTEDVVVPANHISLRGAHETVVAVDSVNQHTAITSDPDALRAVRAALEGRPPPCVGLGTALRSAVAPVVISRESHLFGEDAHVLLGFGAGL